MNCSELTTVELQLLYYFKTDRGILQAALNLGKSYNYVAGMLERLYSRGFMSKERHKNEVHYLTLLKVVIAVEEELKKRRSEKDNN